MTSMMKNMFKRGISLLLIAQMGWVSFAQTLNVSIKDLGDQNIRLEWPDMGDGFEYTVEFSDALNPGDWKPLPHGDGWPDRILGLTDHLSDDLSQRFYRIIATPTMSEGNRGRLISAESIATVSALQLNFVLAIAGIETIQAKQSARVFKVVYETVDAQGNSVQASGQVSFPADAGNPVPMVSYQHGTVVDRDDVPSRYALTRLESIVPVIMASNGYLGVAPDYLGLGDSSGFHPYIIAKPSATCVVDLIRAAKALAEQESYTLNDQLFLFGYSEGGYVTMAAHQELEALHAEELPVTASIPMAGPYDVSGVLVDTMLSDQPYSNPFYLMYVILAYHEVYNFFDDPAEIFSETYATRVREYLKGSMTLDELQNQMPKVPKAMLNTEFVEAFSTDTNHPFRELLRQNDLIQWAPQAPMRLIHCGGDLTVPFENSQLAYNHFTQSGKTNIELIDPFALGDHSQCILPALQIAKSWMDELKE